jgi:hypothetical protein
MCSALPCMYSIVVVAAEEIKFDLEMSESSRARAIAVDDWLPLLGLKAQKQTRQVTGAWHDLKNLQLMLRTAFTSSSASNARYRELKMARELHSDR